MSATPRTDAVPHNVANLGVFARKLERELNAANERIKRLEEAGGGLLKAMLTPESVDYSTWVCLQADARNAWRKAKEAKP